MKRPQNLTQTCSYGNCNGFQMCHMCHTSIGIQISGIHSKNTLLIQTTGLILNLEVCFIFLACVVSNASLPSNTSNWF